MIFKNFAISFLSKLNLYHIYINLKYNFFESLICIIAKYDIICFKYFNFRTSKIEFFIQRESFGESIYDYINSLTNIKKFVDDPDPKSSLKEIKVYITGKKINTVLDDWFNYNFQLIIKNKLLYSLKISNGYSYRLTNEKILYLIYKEGSIFLLKKNYYLSSRSGTLNSYANRFNISENYNYLLNDKKLKSIEYFAQLILPNYIKDRFNIIFSKKVIVFYDYDIKNRITRKNISSKLNELKDDLYLRFFDNSIIKNVINDLLNQNFNVVRLGRSDEKFLLDHQNFFDFAYDYSNYKFIESLDFLIPSKARFCITLGSGAHECSRLYNLPILFVGYHRYDNFCNLSNSMLVTKKFYDSKTGNLIPLSKLINKRIIPYSKKYWESSNIIIMPPTSRDINKSLREFLIYIDKIENNNFSTLKKNKINLWQNLYLNSNRNFQKYKDSKNRYSKSFSVIISEYELEKYKMLFFE